MPNPAMNDDNEKTRTEKAVLRRRSATKHSIYPLRDFIRYVRQHCKHGTKNKNYYHQLVREYCKKNCLPISDQAHQTGTYSINTRSGGTQCGARIDSIQGSLGGANSVLPITTETMGSEKNRSENGGSL